MICVLAMVALVTAKAAPAMGHRNRCGNGLPIALYRPVLFPALLAVFSFYAAFSGYRITKLKDLARGGHAKAIDWVAAQFTFVASACLAGFGALRPAWVQHMGIVAIVFGLLGMRLAAAEILKCARKPKERCSGDTPTSAT